MVVSSDMVRSDREFRARAKGSPALFLEWTYLQEQDSCRMESYDELLSTFKKSSRWGARVFFKRVFIIWEIYRLNIYHFVTRLSYSYILIILLLCDLGIYYFLPSLYFCRILFFKKKKNEIISRTANISKSVQYLKNIYIYINVAPFYLI